MNFLHLNYVIEIAKQGSISKAAKHLYITQPYLSRILKEVESELNMVLFVRSPKGIVPTPQGQDFIERAEAILGEFNALQENLIVQPEQGRSVFTITSVRSSMVMETFLRIVRSYESQMDFKFTYKESGGLEPLNDVVYHRSDLAIMFNPSPSVEDSIIKKIPEYIVYEKICDMEFCLVLGMNHPLLKEKKEITLDMLDDYPFVFYEKDSLPFPPSSNEDFLSNILKLSKHPKRILVNSRASFHNILSQTNSFAIGNQAAKGQEKIFNIVSIPLPTPKGLKPFEMGVAYRKETKNSKMVKEFVLQLKENYSI